MKKKFLSLVFVVSFIISALPATAFAQTITFDDVPSGKNITNYYSNKGVIFGTHAGRDSKYNMATGNVYAVTNYTPAGNNILGLTSNGGIFINEKSGYFKAYFPKPVKKVSIKALPVLMPEYFGTPTARPFMQAFNNAPGQQKFLGQSWYPSNLITSNQWKELTISRPTADISYIYFSSSYSGPATVLGAFDTLKFEY